GPRCQVRYPPGPARLETMSRSGAFEAMMSAVVVPRPPRPRGGGPRVSPNSVCVRLSISTKLETLGFQDVRIKTSNPQILRFSDFQSGSPRIVLKLRDIAERLQCRLE